MDFMLDKAIIIIIMSFISPGDRDHPEHDGRPERGSGGTRGQGHRCSRPEFHENLQLQAEVEATSTHHYGRDAMESTG